MYEDTSSHPYEPQTNYIMMMLSIDAEVRVEELRVRIGCHAFQINVAALKVTT